MRTDEEVDQTLDNLIRDVQTILNRLDWAEQVVSSTLSSHEQRLRDLEKKDETNGV